MLIFLAFVLTTMLGDVINYSLRTIWLNQAADYYHSCFYTYKVCLQGRCAFSACCIDCKKDLIWLKPVKFVM